MAKLTRVQFEMGLIRNLGCIRGNKVHNSDITQLVKLQA